MTEALAKAQRRASKVTNYLRHMCPGNGVCAEDIQQWARAIDAASTVERYLERCEMKDTKLCITT